SFCALLPRPPSSTLFPYTTLFRSDRAPDEPPGAGGTDCRLSRVSGRCARPPPERVRFDRLAVLLVSALRRNLLAGNPTDAFERSGLLPQPRDVWRGHGSRVRNVRNRILRSGGTLPREHGPVLGCGAHPVRAELAARWRPRRLRGPRVPRRLARQGCRGGPRWHDALRGPRGDRGDSRPRLRGRPGGDRTPMPSKRGRG